MLPFIFWYLFFINHNSSAIVFEIPRHAKFLLPYQNFIYSLQKIVFYGFLPLPIFYVFYRERVIPKSFLLIPSFHFIDLLFMTSLKISAVKFIPVLNQIYNVTYESFFALLGFLLLLIHFNNFSEKTKNILTFLLFFSFVFPTFYNLSITVKGIVENGNGYYGFYSANTMNRFEMLKEKLCEDFSGKTIYFRSDNWFTSAIEHYHLVRDCNVKIVDGLGEIIPSHIYYELENLKEGKIIDSLKVKKCESVESLKVCEFVKINS